MKSIITFLVSLFFSIFLFGQADSLEIGSFEMGDWNLEEAKSNYNEDLRNAIDRLNLKPLTIETLDDIHNILNTFQGIDPKGVFHFSELLIDKGNEIQVDSAIIFGLKFKSLAYTEIGDFISAQTILEESLNYSKRVNFLIGEAESNSLMATIYYYQGKYIEGIEFGKKGLKLFTQIKLKEGIFGALSNLGNCYLGIGKFQEAVEHYTKALKISEGFNGEKGRVMILQNLANCYFNIGDYIEARKYAKQCLDLASPQKRILEESVCYNILGACNLLENKLTEAKTFFLKSLKGFEKMSSLGNLATIYSNIGAIYLRMNLQDSCIYWNKKAELIAKNINSPEVLLPIYSNYAAAYANKKLWQESDLYYEKCIRMCEENKDDNCLMQLYQAMAVAQQEKGDFSKSLIYYQRYHEKEKQILGIQKQNEIEKIKIEYETEKTEQELTKEKALTQLQATEIQRNQISLFGALFFIVFLGGGFFVINKKNKQLALETNKSETLLKEVQHRVKNNLMFVASLLDLQSMSISNVEAQKVVEEGRDRIEAMGLLHQKLLYQNDQPTIINMKEYLEELLQVLKSSFQNLNQIQLVFNIDPLKLDVDKAMPIGLIVNELVNNAAKHKNKENKLCVVNISLTETEKMKLVVEDNGKGLPDDFDISKTNSFGLKLVELLSRQIEGKLNISNNHGARFELIF